MTETYEWADHRIFAAAATPDGKSLLFDANQASLFALDRATQEVLDRWRSRNAIALHEAPASDREVLAALCDAQVLVPSAWRTRSAPSPIDPAGVPLASTPPNPVAPSGG